MYVKPTDTSPNNCFASAIGDKRQFIDGVVNQPGALTWVPVSSLTTSRLPEPPRLSAKTTTIEPTALTLTWSAFAAGDSPVTGYRVRVSPAGIDRTVTTPSVQLTGLPVTARFHTLDVPVKVASATLTPGMEQVTARWVPATDTRGASAPADYQVTLLPENRTVTVPGNLTSYTFRDVTGPVQAGRTVSITPRNAAGQKGAAETVLAGATPLLRPQAVEALRALPFDGGIEVTWTLGSANGEPYTHFNVRVDDGTTVRSVGTTGTRARVTGLTNGREVNVTVETDNGASLTRASTSIKAVAGPLEPPVGLTSSQQGTVRTLKWSPPAGLSGTVRYRVDGPDGTAGQTNDTTWTQTAKPDGTFPALGVSTVQTSDTGTLVSDPVWAGFPPDGPATVTATPVPGTSSVKVDWTPVSPAPAGGYEISVADGDLPSVVVPAGQRTATLDLSAIAGRWTTVSVTALHTARRSSSTRAVVSVTGRPGRVKALAVQPLDGGRLRVRWEAPTNDGALPGLTYRVTSPALAQPLVVTENTADLPGSDDGTPVDVTVTAFNAAGDGRAAAAQGVAGSASVPQFVTRSPWS